MHNLQNSNSEEKGPVTRSGAVNALNFEPKKQLEGMPIPSYMLKIGESQEGLPWFSTCYFYEIKHVVPIMRFSIFLLPYIYFWWNIFLILAKGCPHVLIWGNTANYQRNLYLHNILKGIIGRIYQKLLSRHCSNLEFYNILCFFIDFSFLIFVLLFPFFIQKSTVIKINPCENFF